MELIKENNKRWIIIISLSLAILYACLLLYSRATVAHCTLFILVLFGFFTLIFYLRKKTYLIYFSENGVKFSINTKVTIFSWSDLKIDLKQKYINYLHEAIYTFSSKDNTNKKIVFSICWENEKSIIELTKKYVPQNHDLYRAVSDYTKKRGLEF
ncbi:MAG: hypothetical protein H7336_14110 [Bacteriovorax sp.]|nr:hypothetical protein [Bacteriovorax sp.]